MGRILEISEIKINSHPEPCWLPKLFFVMNIHVIASPRNVSTALMYSFGQHKDILPIDEPFYASYLRETDKDHPDRELILRNQPTFREKVFDDIQGMSQNHPVLFIKNMAHHILESDFAYMKSWKHVFLIRHPRLHIRSFSKVIPEPTLHDLGTTTQRTLYDILKGKGGRPYVIDSNKLLEKPELELKNLCNYVNIDFDPSMLSWPAGPKPFDGCWASHWYKNAWSSTEFGPAKDPKTVELQDHLNPLMEACLVDYEYLLNQIKK